MKTHWVCSVGALFAVASVAAQSARTITAQAPTMKTVVVAELFTSEGCSSCPSADAVLTELVQRQPVAGVEVLALGEHVDYWDRLGWRDPFSSPVFSARQSTYDAQVFRSNRVYTPQLVVDGQLERVGSDVHAVQRAIAQAANSIKAAVGVAAARVVDRPELQVDLQVDLPAGLVLHDALDVMVAVTEDHLETDVRRGENRGRTLKHSAVVRRLTTVGELPSDAWTWTMRAPVGLAPEWKTDRLRIIAFLQERQSRRIVGAGSSIVANVATP